MLRYAGDGRYTMHELTRRFAAEQLRVGGLEAATGDRHAAAYLRQIPALIYGVGSTRNSLGFAAVEWDLENYRAALRWLIDGEQFETALILLAGLFLPWLRRGHWREGERWYREVLVLVGDAESGWVCQSLVYLSTFIALQGRYAEAAPFSERALAMVERVDDLLAGMAVAEQQMQLAQDLDTCRDWFERLMALLPQWEHPVRPLRLAGAYHLFGDRLRDAGRTDEAAAHYRRSIELFGDIESDLRAYPVGNLGRLALAAGRLDEADALLRESVAIARRRGEPGGDRRLDTPAGRGPAPAG